MLNKATHMAATKNTLMAMWGKSSAVKAKENSSDICSVHSTRSRAAEERSAPDKEATSRLSKPDNGRSKPGKANQAPVKDVCQSPMLAVSSSSLQGHVSRRLWCCTDHSSQGANATCLTCSCDLGQVLGMLIDASGACRGLSKKQQVLQAALQQNRQGRGSGNPRMVPQ